MVTFFVTVLQADSLQRCAGKVSQGPATGCLRGAEGENGMGVSGKRQREFSLFQYIEKRG